LVKIAKVCDGIGLNGRLVFLISILAVTLVVSAFIIAENGKLNVENEGQNFTDTLGNHFSVVWRGFIPDYDPSYPDYYICINDLAANTIPLDIRLYIQNQESSGYYFKISPHTSAPSGWSVPEYFVGYIGVDQTKDFVYSIERSKPLSISEGRITEKIDIRVAAYYDQSYTKLYSYDNFTVTIHLIDRSSSAWTLLYYDNFDDGTNQGWSSPYQGVGPSTRYYRSFRYSFAFTIYASKSYYVGAGFKEAYAVLAIRFDISQPDGYPMIFIDDILYFKPDVGPLGNRWYQIVIPLHPGTNKIKIQHYYPGYTAFAYIDDVYIIAK
jgi:hypothetical protein